MLDEKDTGKIMEVPVEQRMTTDEGYGSNALEGGSDTQDLDEIFKNPGKVAKEVVVR